MGNIVSLYNYDEDTAEPEVLKIIRMINNYAEKQGIDTSSVKYKYDCATITTLIQLMG